MAYEIYQILLYNFPFDKVHYPRPCVVIDIASNGKMAIVPISTKRYSVDAVFVIDPSHPDFALTGLETTSYIYGHPVVEIGASDVLKVMGRLDGELKAKFENWIG